MLKNPFYGSAAATEHAFARHLSAGKAAFYRSLDFHLMMGTRQGPWFEDLETGARFFNCHSNGGVFNLGHAPERVRRALIDALSVLDIGNHHLVSPYRVKLAERLAATTGNRLPRVVFGSSGGEAVDLAIKVARAATGRAGVVSALGGYHGHTGLAMSAGDASYRDPFGATSSDFHQVPFDDLAALDAAVGDRTAAVLLEPIPATLGMVVPREGYLEGVARLCLERGVKLLVDEVQTGLGRTGRTWAIEHEGLWPDALITGKGLSGGMYPITATLMTDAMHAVLDRHPFAHLSTFGGAEPGCVAALTVLDVIGEPGFLARVTEVSQRLVAELEGQPWHTRGRGLMLGLAFDSPSTGPRMAIHLVKNGIFTLYSNNDPSVVQFLPPLNLTDAELGELIARVRKAFPRA